MNSTNRFRQASGLAGSSVAMALAMGWAVPANAQQTPDSVVENTYQEEIIVTATRRAQSVQDVPISITAITGEDLFDQGITDFAQLSGSTPSVALQEGGPGFRTVYIRGVSTGVIGTSSTTGFYYDESYVEPGGLVLGIVEPLFFDVDRVEILRGPQGTLFGGSSMGGTIRFISKTPNLSEFEGAVGGQVSSTKGGGINYETSGVLNVPIVEDMLGLRVTANLREDSGFIDRLVGNFPVAGGAATGPVQVEEDIDDSQFFGGRAILEAQPSQDVMLRLTGVYQSIESDALPVIDQLPGNRAQQQRSFSFDDFLEDEFYLVNFLATYNFGNFEILSSTSYNERTVDYLEDSDGDSFFGLNSIFVAADREEDTFSQEVRLTSDLPGRFNFVVGGLYEEYNRDRNTNFFNGNGDVDQSLLFFPIAAEQSREQVALFGEATYELTDQLTLTAGARYYDYTNELFNPNINQTATSEEDGINPRFQIAYEPSDATLLYASAAKGFRPGGARLPLILDADTTQAGCESTLGVNVNADGSLDGFESDSLWTYEAGVKTQFADGRVTANASGYYTDWSDIQLFAAFPDPCQVSFFTANVAGARIYGAELEFDAQLSESFALFGGISYTDAETTEDVPGSFLTSGSPLQNVPDWTVNLNAQYSIPVGKWDASLLATLRHTGESSSVIIPSPTPPVQESFSIVNLRANFDLDDLQLSFFINNVSNTLPLRTFFATSFGLPRANEKFFTERPRTVGVSLRKDF
ncbi:MAG: TonB-dependent receptor [Pseudomonadota bacterium]